MERITWIIIWFVFFRTWYQVGRILIVLQAHRGGSIGRDG
jgi:hypothetical protein